MRLKKRAGSGLGNSKRWGQGNHASAKSIPPLGNYIVKNIAEAKGENNAATDNVTEPVEAQDNISEADLFAPKVDEGKGKEVIDTSKDEDLVDQGLVEEEDESILFGVR